MGEGRGEGRGERGGWGRKMARRGGVFLNERRGKIDSGHTVRTGKLRYLAICHPSVT